MKRIIIALILVFPFVAMAQTKKFEYTPKVKNKIEVKNLLGGITLQNTTGNSIIIESNFDMERPDRADGLKLLGAMEDNTDLGINVTEENGVVHIEGATKQVRDYNYKILVPTGMALALDYSSPFAKGNLNIDSYAGSLEIHTLNANVKATNTSGPLTINSISGNVEVVFSKVNQDEPTSLASVSGFIDVTVPATEKLSFDISNITGNVYNNLDLKSNSAEQKDQRASGMDVIKQKGGNQFTMNGGGQKIFLNAVSGNIYLRKK